MGLIRKMCELLAAAGFEVHDVSRPNISRGAGFHPDEWDRLSEYAGKPDPPGVITTNYQPPKPKAIKVDNIDAKAPKSKRRGRTRKSATPYFKEVEKLCNAQQLHKSKRPPSLFDLFRRLKGGEK